MDHRFTRSTTATGSWLGPATGIAVMSERRKAEMEMQEQWEEEAEDVAEAREREANGEFKASVDEYPSYL